MQRDLAPMRRLPMLEHSAAMRAGPILANFGGLTHPGSPRPVRIGSDHEE
jgi:hypothetical protein